MIPSDRGPESGGGVDFAALRRARILYWMGSLCLPLAIGAALGYLAGTGAWQGPLRLGLSLCAVAALGVGLMSVGLVREQRLNGPSLGKQRVLLGAVLVLLGAVGSCLLAIALGHSA